MFLTNTWSEQFCLHPGRTKFVSWQCSQLSKRTSMEEGEKWQKKFLQSDKGYIIFIIFTYWIVIM